MIPVSRDYVPEMDEIEKLMDAVTRADEETAKMIPLDDVDLKDF